MASWSRTETEAVGFAFSLQESSNTQDESPIVCSTVSVVDNANRGQGEQAGFTEFELAQISRAMMSTASEGVHSPHGQPISLKKQDLVFQRRTGSHHGRGGRPRGTGRKDTVMEVSKQVASVAVQALATFTNSNFHVLATSIAQSVRKLKLESENWHWEPQHAASLKNELRALKTKIPKQSYTILKAPILCITSNIGTIDAKGAPDGNIKDRYASSFWMDTNGSVHCSCFGSTRYRILRPLFVSWEAQDMQFCVHMRGFLFLIDAVCSKLNVERSIAAKALSHLYASLCSMAYAEYLHRVPALHVTHETGNNAYITVLAEVESQSQALLFVPIRTIRKSVKRDVCLFCDNTGRTICHHVRSFGILHEDEHEPTEPYMTHRYELSSVSQLPVGPVSCPKSAEIDAVVCEKARKGEPFLALAPIKCTAAGCNGERNEKSRKVYTDGVLMCTIGPCIFHYEYYACSICGRRIGPDGRENYITIEKVTSAATHNFLRKELSGVVLSLGTLTGRLKHYRSQVTANQYFKLLPENPRCLSLTALRSLCVIMLRLMTSHPPLELFTCLTCEFDNGERRPRLKALCMDGINQGHLRRCLRSFKNISEKCLPLPTPRRKPCPSERERPLENIVRFKGTVQVLLKAIGGETLSCTERSFTDFTGAVQLVEENVIPPDYCTETICAGYGAEQIGEVIVTSTVAYIRSLLSSIFKKETLLSRLLHPLLSYSESSRKCTFAFVSALKEKLDALPSMEVLQPNEVYWMEGILAVRDRMVRNDFLRLLKMILQGPATQFIPRSSIKSMRRLADLCCQDCSDTIIEPEVQHVTLLQLLQEPSILTESSGTSGETNVLKSCLLLQAGIRSISILEESDMHLGRTVRNGFGRLLAECADVVEQFYSFYDDNRGTESAGAYRREWGNFNAVELREKLVQKYRNHSALDGNSFQVAVKTGFYFPAHPQIRPLPFNVEENLFGELERTQEEGYCTKQYSDADKRYTPCCLTFVCSCFHPLILGFKSTHSAEGTRIIMDTIMSRFGSLPEYLIYDYSCGLYNSARHTLWWAIEDTTIVTDFFHFKNHCCSPSYEPGAHLDVNSMNTVAHEQRNRAIKELSKSLRNGSQEFYISLLAYQCIVRNIQAKSLASEAFRYRPSLKSEYDIEWCFFECLKLSCLCCTSVT